MDKFELPLFPLNTVLYPGLLLPLVIFEPRYLKMVQGCLDEERPFGVVLIKQGEEAGGDVAEPYSVGTTARIVQVQRQGEERLYIWTVGEERIKVWDYTVSSDAYLVGTVSRLDQPVEDVASAAGQVDALKQLLQNYLGQVAAINQKEVPDIDDQLSGEPGSFSYQVATILDIDVVEKQTLLEIDTAAERLNREAKIIQRELELLKLNTTANTFKLPWGDDINLN